MKIQINNAIPLIHKHKDYVFSVQLWNVVGKVIPDCNCEALAKRFDIYIEYNDLVGSKQKIYQLTKNKLETDGEII